MIFITLKYNILDSLKQLIFLGFDDNLLTFQSAPVSSPDDVSSLLSDLIMPATTTTAPSFKPPIHQIPKLPSPPKPKAPSVGGPLLIFQTCRDDFLVCLFFYRIGIESTVVTF